MITKQKSNSIQELETPGLHRKSKSDLLTENSVSFLFHDEAPAPYITIPQYLFNKTKQHWTRRRKGLWYQQNQRVRERVSEAKRTGEKEDTKTKQKRWNKFIFGFQEKNCAYPWRPLVTTGDWTQPPLHPKHRIYNHTSMHMLVCTLPLCFWWLSSKWDTQFLYPWYMLPPINWHMCAREASTTPDWRGCSVTAVGIGLHINLNFENFFIHTNYPMLIRHWPGPFRKDIIVCTVEQKQIVRCEQNQASGICICTPGHIRFVLGRCSTSAFGHTLGAEGVMSNK